MELKKSLTQSEQIVLNAIEQYINENNYSPTLRELMKITDIKSTATIHRYIDNLCKKEFLTKNKEKSRTLMLVKSKQHMNYIEFVNILKEIIDKNYSIKIVNNEIIINNTIKISNINDLLNINL